MAKIIELPTKSPRKSVAKRPVSTGKAVEDGYTQIGSAHILQADLQDKRRAWREKQARKRKSEAKAAAKKKKEWVKL